MGLQHQLERSKLANSKRDVTRSTEKSAAPVTSNVTRVEFDSLKAEVAELRKLLTEPSTKGRAAYMREYRKRTKKP